MIYNDHASTFFFDLYPTFAMGVSATFPIADEGAGPRPLPALKGHPELAAHLAEQLVNDEFDMTLFQEKPVDHGCLSPLPLLWPPQPDWPGCIVPIVVNVLQYPLPTAARCYKLGQALRRAIECFPRGFEGSGGVGTRAACLTRFMGNAPGLNNTDWDMRFLDLIEHDPLPQLTRLRHARLRAARGAEGAERSSCGW